MFGQECGSVRGRSESAADEAGTASTLQGSGCRAVVKDRSDANRAVNRLKQTEDAGLPHSVHFGCSTRLGSPRRFDTGRLHGRFHHVSTSPTGISIHVTHILVIAQSETKCICISGWRGFLMSEGLAECEWISGMLESAVYQDYEPSLHRRKSISLPAEPTVTVMKADSYLQIDPSTVCVSSMRKVLSVIWYETRR